MYSTPRNEPTSEDQGTSVLATLRALLPERRLRLDEALRIAELQADRLLHLHHVQDVPVPSKTVSDLPRITVEYDEELGRHAASGASHWCQQRRSWVIAINPEEPRTRQRFTLMHEYKHILDHYHPGLGGRLPRQVYGLDPTEYVAEYFAGCALMPKRWVKATFYDGIQRAADLAELFDVSTRAMEVRLSQLGLSDAGDATNSRTASYRRQPRPSLHHYYRPSSVASVSPFREKVPA